MGFYVGNLTRETSTTTGTGDFTLAGAVSAKYTTLNSDIPLGFGFYGKIEHQSADEWEIGLYELTASSTLARRFVIKSSNANALVNFSAGTKHIFSDIPGALVNQQIVAQGTQFVLPIVNATTMNGPIAVTQTGTRTAAAITTTNVHTGTPRSDVLVTTAATTAVASSRANNNHIFLSSVNYMGGFDCEFIFGGATGQSTPTKRLFGGITNSTGTPTDVNPSTLLNMIGFGYDSADSNLQFMSNDGTSTATKVDCGANFVKPTTDRAKMYFCRLYAFPNSSRVGWWVQDIETGNKASGVATTDLPAANTLLSWRCIASVGGTSSVIGVADGGFMVRSPYLY